MEINKSIKISIEEKSGTYDVCLNIIVTKDLCVDPAKIPSQVPEDFPHFTIISESLLICSFTN
jgi:hypothetical protein